MSFHGSSRPAIRTNPQAPLAKPVTSLRSVRPPAGHCQSLNYEVNNAVQHQNTPETAMARASHGTHCCAGSCPRFSDSLSDGFSKTLTDLLDPALKQHIETAVQTASLVHPIMWSAAAFNYYSLHSKIIVILEFKFYFTKNANFDPPTMKDKIIFGRFSKKTTNCQLLTTSQKTRSIFVILHLVLIYVLGPKIVFISRQRE